MSFVKILGGEHLDEMSYVRMRDHAKLAIERIRKFTKSYEFEVADDILLEINLGILEMNFERFMQCNTLLVSINSANDFSESMEDIYTEIKMELMTKQRCNSQNDNGYNGPSEPKKNEEETEKELPKELYKNIVQAKYSDAVNVTKDISSRGHRDIITSVVNRLAQEGNRNLLSYVYQLWLSGQNDILQYMPKPIQAIFSEWVILKQKKFGLPLKMDVKTDSDGDRVVWGDASDKRSLRVNWKLIPFWENNCVFFHAQNMEHNMFLKLALKPDDIGDRGAFGSTESGTTRHDWILEPVVIDGEVFFYIVNREYNQGLKLAMSTDSLGDRKLWGHNGDFHREPSHFAWSIKKEEETEKELPDPEELYKNIVQAKYSDAVTVTKDISSRGHGDIITSVVNRLAQEGNRNLLSYVYQLWLSGQNDILQHTPKPIQAIFSEWVILKQKKFGLPLKMDVKTDSDGDRVVWGDASDKRSLRVNWKLIPFWENNCVFFHAQNMEHNMFLKLEVKPDGIGDRGAFGSTDSGTTRHDWILEPVVIDGEVFFYIVNRQYNQGLKLAMSTDSLGVRKLWGHNGDFHREPSRFAWSINKEEETEKELPDPEELYKNIVQAKYSDAVNVTKDISSRGHGDIITSVVNRLAQEGNRNLLSYVYQLSLSGQNDILQHTPKPIQAIFSEWVILKQKKFGLPLKMDVKTDSNGDRVVWGDASDKRRLRVNWKLIPFWENNCVFFHAQNMEHNMFLKLEVKPDGIGDRGAFGSTDSGTTRHDWILEPVVIDGEVFFYIVNRQYNQGLKLAMSTDSLGDRKLWGHNGDFHREPSHFAWSINLNL